MADITIPPAALEAGAKELAMQCRCAMACDWRNHLDDARACCLAMLEAWEGMAHYRGGWEPVIHNNRKPHLILPLTEKTDDKA